MKTWEQQKSWAWWLKPLTSAGDLCEFEGSWVYPETHIERPCFKTKTKNKKNIRRWQQYVMRRVLWFLARGTLSSTSHSPYGWSVFPDSRRARMKHTYKWLPQYTDLCFIQGWVCSHLQCHTPGLSESYGVWTCCSHLWALLSSQVCTKSAVDFPTGAGDGGGETHLSLAVHSSSRRP